MSTTTSGVTLTVESSDVIRLILAYLTSLGLHSSVDCLRKESGVGFTNKGLVNAAGLSNEIREGEWGTVSRVLSLQQQLDPLQTQIHGHIILELAEQQGQQQSSSSSRNHPNPMELAYSVFRVLREDLDRVTDEDEQVPSLSDKTSKISLARSLEQKLAALTADPTKYKNNPKERQSLLYSNNKTRQERRNELATKFDAKKYQTIDLNRLPTLLQQSIQWQAHTGQLPYIQEILQNDGNDADKQIKKRKKKRKLFDLLLGTNAAIENASVVGDELPVEEEEEEDEPVPEEVYHKIKFGKSAVCETATWMITTASNNNLITGSSDGLIEIWKGDELNVRDYPYQDESVMGHSQAVLALEVSNDGQILVSGDKKGCIKVWKLSSGKCLRQYQAQEAPVTCLALTRDAARVLTGSSSGQVKEFGLVTQTILQEYMGHSSYIHSCHYVVDGDNLWVVTGSADGTVRIWSKQGECQRILQPPLQPSSSLVVSKTQLLAESPAISIVLSLPFQAKNHLILVPRSSKAYMVDLQGTLARTFAAETPDTIFCAACCTATWLYLVTQKGDCLVFSLSKGTLQTTIREFALDSTGKSTSTSPTTAAPEVTQVLAHPFKPIVAALSNDKTQKRGVLTVWK